MYDSIIIGAGPAGMGAAIYAKRAMLNILVLDQSGIPGGQMINTYEVDNYLGFQKISGMDLSDTMMDHVKSLGAEICMEKVSEIKRKEENWIVVSNTGQEWETKSIILATGAKNRMLQIEGEEKLKGMGVSYCATCDGAFFRNRTVAVVGGGDVALEDAIFLARGCKKVYLIHRRDQLRGTKILQQAVFEQENIEVLWDTIPVEITGEGMVDGLKVKNKKTGEETHLEVNGVFVAIGTDPDTKLVKDFVALDERGYVMAREDGVTSCRGIFVAGDCRTKQLRQIVTSVADGANCITSLEKYLL